MAKLPRKEHLDQLDRALGDISVKLDKMTKLDQIFKIDPGAIVDIASSVEKAAKWNERWAQGMQRAAYRARDLRKELEQQNRELQKNQNRQKQIEKESKELSKEIAKQGALVAEQVAARQAAIQKQRDLIKETERLVEEESKLKNKTESIGLELNRMPGKWKIIGKLVGGEILHQFDKLGKSVLALTVKGFDMGFDAIEDGVEKVYDLFERTTKAIGTFTLGLGAASVGLDQMRKSAQEIEGPFRSLTDEFGIGYREIEQFVSGMGFLDSAAKLWSKTSVIAGRALGIGSDAAGQLARSFRLMGQEADDGGVFVDIAKAANAAGVNTAAFGREIVAAKEFMSSFGKMGQKTFLNAAAFVKKLGMSLRSLEQFTTMTDTFDSAATMAAKMNTVFGTSMNALSMLLEDDPGKRFEMVRDQIRMQGKDLANLTRQEKVFMAQQLQISQEELNGIIESGDTWEDFQKKKERADKTNRKNQEFLNSMLSKTRQTLFAFGQAWDKITLSIVKLVRPFTDVLGLTKETEKSLSFGQVMSNIFGKLQMFIEKIAQNQKFQDFMKRMATGFKEAAIAISDFLLSDRFIQTMEEVVKFGQKAWTVFSKVAGYLWEKREGILSIFDFIVSNADKILMVWAGMRTTMFAMNAFNGMKGVSDLIKIIAGPGSSGGAGFWTKLGGGIGSLFGKLGAEAAGFASLLKTAGTLMWTSMKSAASGIAGAFSKVSGTLLGKAGFVAAAALAGWEIGRFVGSLEIGGKKIDDWVVEGFMGVRTFGDKMWRAFKESKIGSFLGMNESADDGMKRIGLNSMAVDKMMEALERIKAGSGNASDIDYVKSIASISKDKNDFAEVLSKGSKGRMSPEQIMTVLTRLGERVPDFGSTAGAPTPATVSTPAVVPTQVTMPQSSSSASAKSSSTSMGGKKVMLVAGDVYLDGKLVGRHLAREMLTEG